LEFSICDARLLYTVTNVAYTVSQSSPITIMSTLQVTFIPVSSQQRQHTHIATKEIHIDQYEI